MLGRALKLRHPRRYVLPPTRRLKEANARKGIKAVGNRQNPVAGKVGAQRLKEANARKGIKAQFRSVRLLHGRDEGGLKEANARKGIKASSPPPARPCPRCWPKWSLKEANARKGIKAGDGLIMMTADQSLKEANARKGIKAEIQRDAISDSTAIGLKEANARKGIKA